MRKKDLLLPAAALLTIAVTVAGILVISSDPPAVELYRIGYFGSVGDVALLWQMAVPPVILLLITLGVALDKTFIRVVSAVLAIAALLARARGYVGIFNESGVGKMIEGGFNTAIYAVFIASQVFAAAAVFLLLFSEREKRLKIFKRIDFIGSLVFAAFYLLASAVALLFVLTENVSTQNIALFCLSALADGLWFLVFAFASRVRFNAAIANCVEFDNLVNK